MPTLETVTGPIDGDSVQLALPHEHVFVDLLGPNDPGYCRVDWPAVRAACVERFAGIRRQGVDLVVDCTAIGIGRKVRLLREVSRATRIRIVCATGIYKGLVPDELRDASSDELAAVFIHELTEGIGSTRIRAGVIKIATTETGATPRETDVHRAGAMAAVATGTSIVLHSPHADVTRHVVATLEAEGFDPARLIWAHAQDSTVEENLELAGRGVTISFDAIGVNDDAEMLDRMERLIGAGQGDQVVVSTDTSAWVNPPDLAYERSIEHLLGSFLPMVEGRFGAEVREGLTRTNVVRALTTPPTLLPKG